MFLCGHNITIVVISLLTPQRREVVEFNKAYWGEDVRVHSAIDGFNETRVAEALQRNHITYHKLCKHHDSFGMLACWLSHYEVLKWQVEQRVDWVARFEDDIRMSQTWKRMLKGPLCVPSHRRQQINAHTADMTMLGSFGEAYLTSLPGARRMVAKLRRYGVRGCQDQQMNTPSFMNTTIHTVRNFNAIKPQPWRFVFVPNRGDIRATKRIPDGWG